MKMRCLLRTKKHTLSFIATRGRAGSDGAFFHLQMLYTALPSYTVAKAAERWCEPG